MERAHAPSVASICDALGRRAIADAVGVRLTQVSNSVTAGQFPARWFDVIDRMCAGAGLSCPRHLFSFVAIEVPADAPSPTAASAAPTQESQHVQHPD